MSKTIREFRGVDNLVYAEVTKDDVDGITFGEVKDLAGVASISKETETNSETHYYDNKAAIVISAAGSDTLTISVSALDQSVEADITGQYYDATTGMYVEGEKVTKYFPIGYKTKKPDGSEIYVWRLKGSFEVPNKEHNTENDGTDANGQELTYTNIGTIYKFNKTKQSAKAINIEAEKTDKDTFFDEVRTPDNLPEVTP